MDDTNIETVKPNRSFGWIFALFIIGVTVTPIWCFFVGPSIRHNRLVSSGIAAHGTLLDVEETGTMVNDAPELKLTVAFIRRDGKPDTATTDFVPSIRMSGYFQQGAMVAIAYDPKDPKEITVTEIGTSSTAPALGISSARDEILRQSDSMKRSLDSMSRELNQLKEKK
ncbi:MAG: DUF3592 domain-containing protein [Candidatus Kapaibacterium sp.]